VQNFRHNSRAVTLLELLTVIVVITILVVMTMPVLDGVRKRTEKVHCMANLQGLYHAANAYVQQHGHWPQLTGKLRSGQKAYERAWVETLEEFGASHDTWICPTVQRTSGGHDYTEDMHFRIDYAAMPFDNKPMTPYRWPRMPWFIESGDLHGRGQLMIFTDGSIQELQDVSKVK
jgi:competence protein ComGC